MLDRYQQCAVEAREKRIFVLAGAGSGKTRVLVSRVLHLRDQGAPLSALCAVTFSKEAAREMEERLMPETSGFLPNSGSTSGMQIGTIHALGFKILRAEIPGRAVADRGHSKRLMRRAMKETGCREKFAEVVNAVFKAKREMLPCPRPYAAVSQAYADLLRQGRVWDFDDLLVQAIRVLEDPDRPALAKWRGTFDEILLDEVQDTSRVQWRLLRCLIAPETRLFLVGDMAQSVYSFRGAHPEVIAEVEHDLGPFTRYELPVNYRSRPQVIALANRVLSLHPGGVVLQPTRDAGPYDPVVAQLPVAGTSFLEGQEIAQAIHQAKETGLIQGWDEAAVLVRVNASTEPIETSLAEAGVPAIVMGGVGFYGRSEVQDVLAYLRLVDGWDYDALARIYNRPSRYLGAAFLRELEAQGGWSALIAGTTRFGSRHQNAVDHLMTDLRMLRERAYTAGKSDPGVAVRVVLKHLKYEQWCLGETPADGQESDAAEALRDVFVALTAAADRWRTVGEFLALADLCARRSRGANLGRVRISTVHRFKGLEAPLVVIAAMDDGIMPHKRGNKDEERRIFYVAVTRARDVLLLSATKPSLFFRECAQHVGPARQLLAEGGLVDGTGDYGHGAADAAAEGNPLRGQEAFDLGGGHGADAAANGAGGSGGTVLDGSGARWVPDW